MDPNLITCADTRMKFGAKNTKCHIDCAVCTCTISQTVQCARVTISQTVQCVRVQYHRLCIVHVYNITDCVVCTCTISQTAQCVQYHRLRSVYVYNITDCAVCTISQTAQCVRVS